MSQYTGALNEYGLPALRTDGEVSEPSATGYGVARVVLTDERGNTLRLPEAAPAPGGSPMNPIWVGSVSGDTNRVRAEGGYIDSVLSSIIAPLSSCGSGVTLVTTAGTRVVLGPNTAIASVTVKALSTNTGLIYVGNYTVSSAIGFALSSSESVSLDLNNLSDLYLDCSVSGEGASYIYAVQ